MTNDNNVVNNNKDNITNQKPVCEKPSEGEGNSENSANESGTDPEKDPALKDKTEENDVQSTENTSKDHINSGTYSAKAKKKIDIYTIIRIICVIGFLVFSGLFINEVFIQPYRAKQVDQETRDLYNPSMTSAPTPTPNLTPAAVASAPTPTPDPTRDSRGRMLSFKELLAKNPDTKGWITIPNTNIDYVVMQNSKNHDYYLTRDFNKQKQKAGCLFLDQHSSVEANTKSMVIHGHNMKSTNSMFHHLVKFKNLDFYKKSPVFTFNTIFENGKWKIFAVFITNGTSDKEPFFDYTKSHFKSSSDFLNFVYQLRIRSLFNIDTVDVNANDHILCLSTCSYELNNYRTVVVARRVRAGEDASVDVDSVTKNPHPLYPMSYDQNYHVKAPQLPDTFEEAKAKGLIKWYKGK